MLLRLLRNRSARALGKLLFRSTNNCAFIYPSASIQVSEQDSYRSELHSDQIILRFFGLDPHAVKPSYSGNPASAQSCSQKFRGLFSLITVLEPRIVESPFFDASHENGAKIRCGWGWFLPRPSSPARRTSRSRQTVGRGKDRWDSARFHPRTPTQAGSLCYIALRSVERFVEMLPEGSSARPPLPRDGVS